MPHITTVAHRASVATDVLEDAWEQLQKIIDGLPRGVMLPMALGGHPYALGHFAANTWRTRRDDGAHEIAIHPGLFKDKVKLLMVLVHEAVHAVLFEEDPESTEHHAGCSLRDPRYHTSVFRDRCLEVGLDCEMRNRRYGFIDTAWPRSGVPEQYHEVLAFLRKEMPLGAKREAGPRAPRNWNPSIRLDCQCRPPRTIYTRRRTALAIGITCEGCGYRFGEFADPAGGSQTTVISRPD